MIFDRNFIKKDDKVILRMIDKNIKYNKGGDDKKKLGHFENCSLKSEAQKVEDSNFTELNVY